jgi:hypothetical protein
MMGGATVFPALEAMIGFVGSEILVRSGGGAGMPGVAASP